MTVLSFVWSEIVGPHSSGNFNDYLYSFFLHYINICEQKGKNSVFYEAFLPITWIKPSSGVTKNSKRMRSNVACKITIPRTVRMVRLCSIPFLQRHHGAMENGDYVLVWHNVFSTVYFLQEVPSIEYMFAAAFKFHRPSYKLWCLDKDPNYLSC